MMIFDGPIARVSTDLTGAPANGNSQQIVMSPDGTKVAFTSAASNLVSDDTNGTSDIFVRDLVTGSIERLSTDVAGGQANGASANPVFSPDGAKIAFVSAATNLAGNDYPWADLYIKDLATGALQKVATNVEFVDVSFSPDGSQLLFLNHDPTTNSVGDVYLADLASGATTFVSGAAFGSHASAVFSADGTKIAFTAGAGLGYPYITGIYVKDLTTGETKVIADHAAYYAADSVGPVFSPDGTKLAYSTVIPGSGGGRVYVEDLVTGERELVSTSPSGWWISDAHAPVFSPDGTKIAFWANSGGFQGTSGYQVLIRDLVTGTLMVASTDAAGNPIHHDPSRQYDLSWNGDMLAFVSQAGNDFAPGDDPAHLDAFVRLMSFASIMPLDANKPEGNSGDTDFTFTVTRSGNLSLDQSVKWAIDDSYQVFGDAAQSGTVDFASGETSKTIVIKVNADTDVGTLYRFHVSLSDPSGGLLVDGGGADGWVKNDDMRAHDDAYVIAPGQSLHVPASTWGSLPPTPVYDPAPSPGTGGMGGFGSYLMTNAITVTTVGGTNTVFGGGFLPNGLNDGLHTGSGKLLAGGVLANDAPQIPPLYGNVVGFIMADGTAGVPQFTASLVEGPSHGTLTLGADGQFDYTPDPGFTGIDRFAYKATGIPSSALGSADAQALIYVVPQIEGDVPTLDLLALSVGQQVAATYLAFFGRGADADGFEFWVDQFEAGQATQTPATLFANIASSFAVSAEAVQQYAFLAHPYAASDMEIGSFLSSVYGNLFGRGVDTAGKAYWTDQIRQKMTAGEFVGSVLVDIMSGAQNPTTSSGPHDALSLMGRVAVGLAYVHEQQEAGTIWNAADNLIEARLILQGVTDTPGTVLTGIARAENAVFADLAGH